MANTAIAKKAAQLDVEKVKLAMRATANRAKAEAYKRRHTMAIGAFSAGVGWYEKSGKTLPSVIPGVPPKIQLAIAAALVSDNSAPGSDTRRYADALCDGMVAISGYNFGRGEAIGAELVGGSADQVVDV